MDSIKNLCEKYAIQNALEHGEAKVGPVMQIIMGSFPKYHKKAQAVKEIVEQMVLQINEMAQLEIEKLASEKYPEILEKLEEDMEEAQGKDFIREIIDKDMETSRFDGKVHTRFPPEPNGYLHIGHATSIIMNYTLAKEYDGLFNFRFDDTNPITEEEQYVKAMIKDIKWLGVYEKRNGGDNVFFASDYFEQMYEYAIQMIEKGKAYVDDLSAEEISQYRGTLTKPGKNSPYRDRSIDENLDLFKRMRKGEFPEGSRVLRAKIDMSSPNLNLRDPVMYRILHQKHPHREEDWCIYPMYDWAHGLEDSIEGITHSICTLEFENHRPLYNWYLEQLTDENGEPIHHPRQIEFARVNISHTIMSKSKLIRLVKEGYVEGWDDPRMPTLAGLRRRGVTPAAIKQFTNTIGVSKRDKVIDKSILNNAIREDLYKKCPRVMGVINPLKIVLTNYPEDKEEEFILANHPKKRSMGTRKVKFTKTLYIEKEDFMEKAPKDYYRLTPSQAVRLKNAYIIKFEKAIKDKKTGEIKEIHCTYEPDSKDETGEEYPEVRGIIHWISAKYSKEVKIRLYNQLFLKANPLEKVKGKDFTDFINPNSLEKTTGFVEPFLINESKGSRFQFERIGYFCIDTKDSKKNKPIFNQIIPLRDSWSND